jgi:hypothetical protein
MARRGPSTTLLFALLLLLALAAMGSRAAADPFALSSNGNGLPSSAESHLSPRQDETDKDGDGDVDQDDIDNTGQGLEDQLDDFDTDNADDEDDDDTPATPCVDSPFVLIRVTLTSSHATVSAKKPPRPAKVPAGAEKQKPAAVPINLYSPNLAIRITLGTVLMLGGIYWTFFGYRSFRTSMFISGLLVGSGYSFRFSFQPS